MNEFEHTLLSSAYLPPIDWFRVVARSKSWSIEQYENYQKQSYRNRCHIYGSNGLLSLCIPIEGRGGVPIPIREAKIDNSKEWQRVHWRALISSYNSSPFFQYYREEFLPFYQKKYELLYQYNLELILLILELLEIEKRPLFTESFQKREGEFNFCDKIHPKRESPFLQENKKEEYYQPFAQKWGYIPNLSIVDLLFNEGPEASLRI